MSSSSPSSSSSKLPSLMCDRELGKLLRESRAVKLASESSASTSTTPITEDVLKQGEELPARLRLLERYEGGDELEDSFPKQWVANVRDAIEAQLDQLKLKFNANANQKKEDDHSKHEMALVALASPTHHHVDLDDHFRELVSKYENLTNSMKFLLMVFTLVHENVVLNKREVLHLWRGLDYHSEIEEGDLALEEGERILAWLVTEGFITCITTNYLSNKYKMKPIFRSWLLSYHNTFLFLYHRKGGFDVGRYFAWSTALINVNNKILINQQELVNYMIDAYIVQFGRWRRQHADLHNNDYIVVHMEFLHFAFKQMHWVRFLSLRGTSGIVHLPNSVSDLEELRFLDLRACNNLESLPKEIGSLENLISLDLSECYLLDHIPHQITSLSNLSVLKGFIVNLDRLSHVVLEKRSSNNCINWCKKMFVSSSSSSLSCPFSALSHLHKLEKLTLRTRRLNFPTSHDLDTLCQLPRLRNLGITWVGNPNTVQMDGISLQALFPNTVEKLELQSAPRQIISNLLKLIGEQEENSGLKKLYIRGGAFQKIISEKQRFLNVEIVRLRYLHDLNMEWHQFKESFPNLTCLEVFQCPNLTSFPCDQNGIWKK